MKKEELIKNIEEAGGKWEAEGVEFSMEQKGTIHAYLVENRAATGFICAGQDIEDFYFSASGGYASINDFVAFYKAVCRVLKLTLELTEAKKLEVIRVVEDPAAKKYEGMVEAYEKILIGREITVGR